MRWVVCILALLLQPNLALAQSGQFDHCNAYLEYGAQTVSRQNSALHRTAYYFSEYCRMESSEMSESMISSAKASIPGLISGSGSGSTLATRKALTSWCSEQEQLGLFTQDVLSEVVDASAEGRKAWNSCQQAARKSVNIALKSFAPDDSFVSFEVDSTLDATIHLLSVLQSGYVCSISHYDEDQNEEITHSAKSPTNTPGFENALLKPISIRSSNAQIDCSRNTPPAQSPNDPVKLVYDLGVIKVNTSVTSFAFSAIPVVDTYFVTPPGAIMAFSTSGGEGEIGAKNCPKGWSHYKSAYGRFLRGIDYGGTGIDPEGQREPGSLQEYAVVDHFHDARGFASVAHEARPNHGYMVGSTMGEHSRTGGLLPEPARSSPHESRPRNVAVTFCEKL